MKYDSNWETLWNICKKHGKTKGMSKPEVYRMRAGYVDVWMGELNHRGTLNGEEMKIWKESSKY